MLKSIAISLMILTLSLTASASDLNRHAAGVAHSKYLYKKWDKEDKILFCSFTALQVADCLQTKEIFRNKNFTEKNPLLKSLGKKSVVPYFAITTTVAYLVADNMVYKNRKRFLYTINAIQIYNVGRNHHIGIRIKF